MAAFDQYLKSVPKIPFVNDTEKTVPPFGVVELTGIDEYGYFSASFATTVGDSNREPDEIYPDDWAAGNPIATEWSCAFNLGNSVEPGNRGYCYSCLPAIVPIFDPYEESGVLVHGKILTLVNGEYKLALATPQGPYTPSGNYGIGWPFLARVPNTIDLVIIGGLVSFEERNKRY